MSEVKLPICTWELVNKIREHLLNQHENYPVLDGLENAWQMLSDHYRVINREDDEKLTNNPFTAFFFYIEMGFYPPPEILLSMNDTFDFYLQSMGKYTLEDVFLGHPVRRAGNYASRRIRYWIKERVKWELHKLLGQGMKRMEAAEQLSEKIYHGAIDPESILRMCRKVKPFKKKADK